MFHSKNLNNKINNVHEKTLRIVYSDYKSTFQELLDKDASFSARYRNNQALSIEIYKPTILPIERERMCICIEVLVCEYLKKTNMLQIGVSF